MKAILKIKEWIETHKDAVDFTIGGGIGAGTGVHHYWDHFFEDENLWKLYDGIINTGIHTIVGALLLWVIRKYIFKHSKNENRRDN
jgi:hypothetical protein